MCRGNSADPVSRLVAKICTPPAAQCRETRISSSKQIHQKVILPPVQFEASSCCSSRNRWNKLVSGAQGTGQSFLPSSKLTPRPRASFSVLGSLLSLSPCSAASGLVQKLYNWSTLNNRVFKRLGFVVGNSECALSPFSNLCLHTPNPPRLSTWWPDPHPCDLPTRTPFSASYQFAWQDPLF